MLTTRRFNRRRAAEIRTRHRERREHRARYDAYVMEMVGRHFHREAELPMGIALAYQDGQHHYEVREQRTGRLIGKAYAPSPKVESRVSDFDQAFASFQAEKLRVLAGAECGAAVAASWLPAEVKRPRGILATVLGWLPWR